MLNLPIEHNWKTNYVIVRMIYKHHVHWAKMFRTSSWWLCGGKVLPLKSWIRGTLFWNSPELVQQWISYINSGPWIPSMSVDSYAFDSKLVFHSVCEIEPHEANSDLLFSELLDVSLMCYFLEIQVRLYWDTRHRLISISLRLMYSKAFRGIQCTLKRLDWLSRTPRFSP